MSSSVCDQHPDSNRLGLARSPFVTILNRSALSDQGEVKVNLVARTTEVDDTVILHCKGRLQFCQEAAVFSKLAHAILDSGRNIVLDFSELDMIDSSGIGELVLVYMRACGSGREVRIAQPSRRVAEILDLTNVSSLFRICSTTDAALGMAAEVVGSSGAIWG
jgi:anti-anti-sigma factor